MRFGGGCTFPFAFGGGQSAAEDLQDALNASMGSAYTRDEDSDFQAEQRAKAASIARAEAYQARAAWQAFPEEASISLPEWERVYGVTPAPNESDDARRALLTALEAGDGDLTEASMVRALETALGEDVSIVTARAPLRTISASLTTESEPSVSVASGGGALDAGAHYVACSWHDGDEVIAVSVAASVTLAGDDAILVAPVGLVAGATRVDYYLSVAAGSSSYAYVASGNGGAIVLAQYPRNPATPGLHHHAIVVSAATAADPHKRAKIHAILGPWLPAHVTLDIVASSPFVLGTSQLGLGAL